MDGGTDRSILERVARGGDRVLVAEAESGVEATGRELFATAERLASRLIEELGRSELSSPRPLSLEGRRIGYLFPPGVEFVQVLLGIWLAGGVAVPLAVSHPEPELERSLETVGASGVLAHGGFWNRLHGLCARGKIPLLRLEEGEARGESPVEIPGCRPLASDPALILFTSGTTSRPKGVVHTHGSVQAQISALVAAWGWSGEDRILHGLPLHHVHGLVNAMLCSLWVGARCDLLPKFDAASVWRHLVEERFTLFMGVPTMYAKLIEVLDRFTERERVLAREASAQLRLWVSGSAALPVPVLDRWREVSGQVILERYGMTEIGMALSNPLDSEERRAGWVGSPLPGVEVRLDRPEPPLISTPGAGELEVRGPSLFREYWEQPEATSEAFRDGWFRTGDLAVEERGVYRILGRKSADVLKSGGYKISAVEIEGVLRNHPAIEDCAVVGLHDVVWGEKVGVAVVSSSAVTLESLREWAEKRLASYKIPRCLVCRPELPRNAMGKVDKKAVVGLIEASLFEES